MSRRIYLQTGNPKGDDSGYGSGLSFDPLSVKSSVHQYLGSGKSSVGRTRLGALVKISSEGLGLAFMVVSQGQGRYSAPNLLSGKYMVRAFGGGYQSASAGPVEMASGQQERTDLVLNIPLQIPPRAKRMKLTRITSN